MSSSIARCALSFPHIGANLRCLTSLNTAANAEGKQPSKLRNNQTQVLETQTRQYSDLFRFDGITKVPTQKPQENSSNNTSSNSQNGPPSGNFNASFKNFDNMDSLGGKYSNSSQNLNSETRSNDFSTTSQTAKNTNFSYPPVATFETNKQTENTQTSFPWEKLRLPHHYNYFAPNMTQQTNEPGQTFPEVLQNLATPTNEFSQNAPQAINPNSSFNFPPQSTYPMNASYNYTPQGPINTFPWENFQSSFDRVFGPNFAKINPEGPFSPHSRNVSNSYYSGAGPQMIGSCTTVSNQPETNLKSQQAEKPITPLDRLTQGEEKPSSNQ